MRDKKGKKPLLNKNKLKNLQNDVDINDSLTSENKKNDSSKRENGSYIEKLKSTLAEMFTLRMVHNLIFNPFYFSIAACFFILLEGFFNIYIIENVKYTEIDWKAYMQEVEGFLNGTYDYTKLKGDTGPLVYPAGFVYIFSILYYITNEGTNVYLAQYIFAGFYLLTLSLVFRIYYKSKKLPPYILVFICCMSYRIHSIYVLRLFNDPVAMLIFYGALNCFVSGWWTLGSLLYSLAVSVKMNVLLYAPALLMSYLYCLGVPGTVLQLFYCFITQVVLGMPFLIENPLGYIINSFNLGRVFLYEWTVNWRFLPEEIFVNPWFHVSLLLAHLAVIGGFAFTHWNRYLINYESLRNSKLDVSCQLFLLPLFVSNFVGIAFSRSLHYQFYVWYFHTIPYLLWSTRLSVPTRLLILGVIELCWNTFPSTWWSSVLLHVCHGVLLVAIFNNRPNVEKVQSLKKKLLKGE